MQFLLTIGVLFNNGLGADGVIPWEILTGLCIIFPSKKSYKRPWWKYFKLFIISVLLAVIMFFMPDSPYYLITKGKEGQARKALQWLRGKDYNIDDEYDEMVAMYEKQQEVGTISLKDFFTKGVYLKPGLIMLALMFFQQFSGINAVLFYLTTIFKSAHVDISAGLSATIVSIVQVVKVYLYTNFTTYGIISQS